MNLEAAIALARGTEFADRDATGSLDPGAPTSR
jgi:hypothetical protein